MAELSRFFKAGTMSDLALVQSYVSSGMVVLVMIEQQRAEIADLPAQDWSLRVKERFALCPGRLYSIAVKRS